MVRQRTDTNLLFFSYPFVELEVFALCSYTHTVGLMSQRFQQANLAVLRHVLEATYGDNFGARLNTRGNIINVHLLELHD
jgi:hypothetical protein